MAKVLFVENELAISNLVRLELTDRGHEVILARSPAGAVQAAWAERPAIILLDIGLGPANNEGFAVLAQLKSESATAATPVVTLTARPDEGWRERSITGGAFAHLVKPVNFDELAEVISLALSAEKHRG